jgi:signal transduction histidine kinase
MTQNWSNYPEEMLKKLKAKLDNILESFDLWRQQGPANYRPAWYLMKAEAARIGGDNVEASIFYEKSSEASGSNIYHFAITHELWAKHLLGIGDQHQNACFHLSEAIRGFNEWGATTKAKQLSRQYQAIIHHLEFIQKNLDADMDIETIQYELSGDMEVASLIKKLMVLLLRISGSTHVVVDLVKDNGDRILYDELSLLSSPSAKHRRKDSSPGKSVPASLILMALKSQKTIVVNDLTTEKRYRDMEGMQERGVQSFLILPVTINGHLSMVIYLENTFAQNWYDPQCVRWARITANQGAVIIENARIHERSVKLNQELRKEMSEKERLASVIEAQKDEHLRALVQTQDDERKRIASDLHDSLGSLLSTVKLRFNGLQEDFGKNNPDKFDRFRDTIGMLDDAIHELRQISHNMLPVSLRRFGLKAALETFVEQVNASRQLDTQLQILGLDRRLPEEIEVAGYRICQELVQNVIKHAQATYINIQVIDHKDSLNIIVEDNGKGMVKKEIARGFGFTTIQSKVDLFKGSFEIDSKPGKGAMVLVDLPVG